MKSTSLTLITIVRCQGLTQRKATESVWPVVAGGESHLDATLAHSRHPRGPILILRLPVQGWEGSKALSCFEGGLMRGGPIGVEIPMDIRMFILSR